MGRIITLTTDFVEVAHSLLAFPLPHPQPGPDGRLVGHVIHIDRFGNLITDIRGEQLSTESIYTEVGDCRIEGLNASYAEGKELLAIIGSSGNLEVSARNNSAATILISEDR